MAFTKGTPRPENAGRKKGSVNQKTRDARELMDRLGFDPLEFLFRTAMGDWKSLGYDKQTQTKVLKDGETIEVDVIQFTDRLTAAKEAAKYVYPQTKALELSSEESKGFVIKIEDYGSKETK